MVRKGALSEMSCADIERQRKMGENEACSANQKNEQAMIIAAVDY
jgi:hypothetical protein